MSELKRLVKILSIVIVFLVLVTGLSNSEVIINYQYNLNSLAKAPAIIFNNSTNFPPIWNTNLNIYKDQAYMNLTSIWSSSIYVDDNGNLFWTDTYGNVFVAWSSSGNVYSLGTPYSYFNYSGPITSIAAINDTSVQDLVVLTYSGYVFGYDEATNTWFNATSQWLLSLTSIGGNWTSVTTNVMGNALRGLDEYFIFTNLAGYVYAYDTTTGISNQWNTITASDNIISTVAFFNENTPTRKHLYGVSYSGKVWRLTNTGWSLYGDIGTAGAVGITIGFPNFFDYRRHIGYLYVILIDNNTKLYKSTNSINSITSTFFVIGNPVSNYGTNAAISYDDSIFPANFYFIQTNGTVGYSSNPTTWNYANNLLFTYMYPTILSINSTYSQDFYAYAHYINSPDYTNLYNLSLYFTGSDNKLELQLGYELGLPMNLAQAPALLNNIKGILINVTMMPNMAYDTHFYFYIIFYPANSNQDSIVFEYVLNMRIIDHFPFIPIS